MRRGRKRCSGLRRMTRDSGFLFRREPSRDAVGDASITHLSCPLVTFPLPPLPFSAFLACPSFLGFLFLLLPLSLTVAAFFSCSVFVLRKFDVQRPAPLNLDCSGFWASVR